MITERNRWFDMVGVGLGPFNLSLAALLSETSFKNFKFFESRKEFNWHPGMLIDETTLQVSFLADLVSLIHPQSKYSFLNYLKEHDRLYNFYFLDRNYIFRKEYNHYCKWVSEELNTENYINFNSCVEDVEEIEGGFKISLKNNDIEEVYYASNIVIGVGTVPHIPKCLYDLREKYPKKIFHSSEFLNNDIEVDNKKIVVLGSGQSSAEITLKMIKMLEKASDSTKLSWITRSESFQPMDVSKLSIEFCSPKYVNYIYNLSDSVRDKLISTQGNLYKGISIKTISDVFDSIYNLTIDKGYDIIDIRCSSELIDVGIDQENLLLTFHERNEGINYTIKADTIISGTGYKNTELCFLKKLESKIKKDPQDRYKINDSYEVDYKGIGGIFIQNGEMHSHGVGSSDLGLGAWRSAIIANKLLGYEHFQLPKKTAFQTFGCLDTTQGEVSFND
ncbi:lysine N(6)-hydroxylase/L-ornithine N(5)-oxygenase family protein [Rosenbergiella nectarea]|uniref:lysine N(6)-hydroxylase/L-ornithine N(5)-oxygenase family protein n=1 Tax=Rosenbergiella nectarea TaxID=988801 RepID=UPI001F4E4C33|nr:SidA/IucD/PvdA family monooxygenase [Rosenbergiella nectarea]